MAESIDKIVADVSEEIKSIGENTKEQFEKVNRRYHELKDAIEHSTDDCVSKEQIEKLSADLSTRQDALDTQNVKDKEDLNDRLDSLEVSLKRLPSANSQDPEKMLKEASEFFKVAKAVQASDNGVKASEEINVDLELYKKYKSTFDSYLRKDSKLITPDQYKALQVGIDPSGGYTVTPAMSARIIKKIYESDPIRQLAASESITSNALEFSVEWDEASAGWEEETVTGAETGTPTFQKKRIPVYTMYARPKATQQLLEDSGINIERWLSRKIADKFMRVEGAAFVTGNGIGKPRGFLTYDDGTTYGTIEQVVSGAAADITADGLKDLKYSLTEYYLNKGTFVMNRSTVAKLFKLKDGEGNYLWRPGLTENAPSVLLGLPVRMSTTMPVIAANALSIVLADFKEAYMIVDRLGITVQRDPFTQKPFVEFYTRKRVGGDVINYEAIKIQKISA